MRFRTLAQGLLSPVQIDALLDRLWHVEQVEDIGQVIRLVRVDRMLTITPAQWRIDAAARAGRRLHAGTGVDRLLKCGRVKSSQAMRALHEELQHRSESERTVLLPRRILHKRL